MLKRLSLHQEFILRPPVPEVRASAGRIVDMLQQLVLLRPDMILPLEEIMNGMLASVRRRAVRQVWAELEARHKPLPRARLSQLSDMLQLLEPATGHAARPAVRAVVTRKRRR